MAFGFRYLTLLAFFLPQSVKATKEEKEEDEDGRYLLSFNFILFAFQLYFIWVFTRLSCSEERLLGLFENNRFSQIRRCNALVIFGVNTSKFGVF